MICLKYFSKTNKSTLKIDLKNIYGDFFNSGLHWLSLNLIAFIVIWSTFFRQRGARLLVADQQNHVSICCQYQTSHRFTQKWAAASMFPFLNIRQISDKYQTNISQISDKYQTNIRQICDKEPLSRSIIENYGTLNMCANCQPRLVF